MRCEKAQDDGRKEEGTQLAKGPAWSPARGTPVEGVQSGRPEQPHNRLYVQEGHRVWL